MISALGPQCDRRRCPHCRPSAKGGSYVWRCTRKDKPVSLVRADDGGLLRTKACVANESTTPPTELGNPLRDEADGTSTAGDSDAR